MADSEAARGSAHEEAERVTRRAVLHTLGPQLPGNASAHTALREAAGRGEGMGTHRAAEDGPHEARETDDALRDAVREADEVRRGHCVEVSV